MDKAVLGHELVIMLGVRVCDPNCAQESVYKHEKRQLCKNTRGTFLSSVSSCDPSPLRPWWGTQVTMAMVVMEEDGRVGRVVIVRKDIGCNEHSTEGSLPCCQ
jgi:hypothetical protein